MLSDLLKVLLFLAGVALILIGVAMVYVPAAFIVGGGAAIRLFKEVAS